jgi:hypothetical protein
VTDDFDPSLVLSSLYDFQRESAEYAFRRLYVDRDSSKRFLIADETGLGKTHIARGVIAKAIEHLQAKPEIQRIDVIYVCSNADIAEQNISKLRVGGQQLRTRATRLTMLVGEPDLLKSVSAGPKPITFVSFTPSTSFNLGWSEGKAEERALLYLLLSEYWNWVGASDTALRRVLQGNVGSLDRFSYVIDAKRRELQRTETSSGWWEPLIRRAFFRSFDPSKLRREIELLVDEVSGRGGLNLEQRSRARVHIGELRTQLARSSLKALDPDLIILDEFQRFRDLLAQGEDRSEAAELAGHLFSQSNARVLLLSATPYRAFTRPDEESQQGEEHYADFIRTLAFLDPSGDRVTSIKEDLTMFRRCILAGDDVAILRRRLEKSLTKLLTRTERPCEQDSQALMRTVAKQEEVTATELTAYVALHRLAQAVDAPMSVEYWKSAPYFANFLEGYQVGEKVKAALRDVAKRRDVLTVLSTAQRLRHSDMRELKRVEWGNCRLRQLAHDTVDQGWWQLLWVPPSLRYYQAGGLFARPEIADFTKRLVFSSWIAAPTAIASLLSYEAERAIRTATTGVTNGDDSKRPLHQRLQFRLDGGRAAAMTTLALFWPNPALAMLCDPLAAAQEMPSCERPCSDVVAWAEARVCDLVADGTSTSSAATSWIAHAAISAETSGGSRAELTPSADGIMHAWHAPGTADVSDEDGSSTKGVVEHVREAISILEGQRPTTDRPTQLVNATALIGLASPGNVAWRGLRRLAGTAVGNTVTIDGLWSASVTLALSFRTLFNRPESILLLDKFYGGDDSSYWQAVLRYCLDGNLQAVVDEYLHHLAQSEGISVDNDDGLNKLAHAAARALAMRSATYQAADLDTAEAAHIPLLSRFALRFGNNRQEEDDVRLPEIRAAFNSPFWPFVLASTSIGQEGVDFHWWCHAVVHWNLPSNPVDFEQREGRINRFKGHAIRKNVATRWREATLQSRSSDPWAELFALAGEQRDPKLGDLKPFWIYAGPAQIERHIPEFPLSKDQPRWREMRQTLALYRLCYGQPRQEDMVELLARRGGRADATDFGDLTLNLRAPRFDHDDEARARLADPAAEAASLAKLACQTG